MDWLSFWLNILSYYNSQLPFAQSSLYLGVGGRIVFLLCFIVFYHILSQEHLEQKVSSPYLIIRIVFRECAYVLLAISNNTIAVFIFAYSTISGGLLLRKAADSIKTRENLSVLKKREFLLLNFLGTLMNRFAPVLGCIVSGIWYFFNFRLQVEFVGIICALGIAVFKQANFKQIKTLIDFFQKKDMTLWKRTPRIAKVLVGIVLVVLPGFSFWSFQQNVYVGPTDYMIPMRDGTLLHTRVYLPKGYASGRLPVIMSRTPYGLEGLDGYPLSYIDDMNENVAIVTQDLRGRYGSQGIFQIFQTDLTDGVDTVNWIRAQPWSDGIIATIGGSAVCTNQYYYQAEGAPGVLSADLMAGAPELYDYWMFPGGCLRQEFDGTWLSQVAPPQEYTTMLEHPMKDSWWANVSLEMGDRMANVNVRAVHVGGWYDVFNQGTINGFEDYDHNGTAYAQNHQILVMGPWSHNIGSYVQPDITYPTNSTTPLMWTGPENFLFQEALFNVTQDWTNQPRVYYYMMGDPAWTNDTQVNVWRNAMDWPLNTTYNQPWYLQPDQTLSPLIPSSTANMSYLYNPADPHQSYGGCTLYTVGNIIGATDERRVEYGRTDIVNFTTPILTSPIEFTGEVYANLTVTSNCTDTDFYVKMMDVFPDGREMWVKDGILKARYQDGYNTTQFLIPGQPTNLMIDMWSTAYRFEPGHRISITITSSDYPKFAVNPNTGGSVNATLPSNYNIAYNTVFCGGPNASSIIFPRSN